MDPLIGLNKHVKIMGPHYHRVDAPVKDSEGNQYYYCIKIGHYVMGYCVHEWQAEATCEALAEVLMMLGWDGHRCPVAMFAESARGFDKSHAPGPKLPNVELSRALRQAEVAASQLGFEAPMADLLPDYMPEPYEAGNSGHIIQVRIQPPTPQEYVVVGPQPHRPARQPRGLLGRPIVIVDEQLNMDAATWSVWRDQLDAAVSKAAGPAKHLADLESDEDQKQRTPRG